MASLKTTKHTIYYLMVAIGSIALWVVMSILGWLDGLEQEAMRWRYIARGELESTADIVYVDLDTDTVQAIGARPWDREYFAVVLNELLGRGGARSVGVDIIFSQIGRGALLDYQEALEGDYALGQVVEKYNDQVVLASSYTGVASGKPMPLMRLGFEDPKENVFPESPSFPIIKWEIGRLGLADVDELLSRGSVPHWVVGFVEVEGEFYSRVLVYGMRYYFYDMLDGLQVIEDQDSFSISDKDGWVPQKIPRYSKKVLYSLGVEVFLAAHGLSHDAVEWSEDRLTIRKDGAVFREVPLFEQQSIEVNWFQGWKTADYSEHVSMSEVLARAAALNVAESAEDTDVIEEQQAWFQRFKDKVIFIGPVDPQLKDVAPTPFNREPVPKVGLHANLFRTLQDQAYVHRANAFEAILILVGLTFAVAFLASWSGMGRAFARVGAVVLVIAYIVGVFWAFTALHLVLPLIAPVASSLTSALGLVLIRLGSEEYQKRRMKNLFGAYVSPALVDEMIDSQRDPELGGVEAEISALFSDVEGFTTVAEQLPPDELVTLMNDYLGAMTDEIQEEGGTLDKYIGDAVVTMFGMPVPIDDHAARACLAAQRMQVRHAELRKRWASEGKWPKVIVTMRTRIGINTGNAVIGNIGSSVRFNYTMMGDSVNLAARCESGAKAYGVYTMVTDTTLEQARKTIPDLPVRKLDRIIVKGRTRPVEVFELWDDSMDLEVAVACRKIYQAGLAHYFQGEWADALKYFEESHVLEPFRTFAITTPSKVMIDRCRWFIAEGSPADWEGVFRMQSK